VTKFLTKQEILSREKESAKAIANKVFSPKLTDAAMAGKKPGCTLFIVEGDSASGGFKKHRLPDGTQGVLAMQGKSMGNVLYDDELRVSDRPAYATLMAAAGLSFMKKSKYRYDKYVLAQDADLDGMPDEWEIANGLNPNDASDSKNYNLNANYTNLEIYLNSLVEHLFP
jgi:DNA gyrase/topoisomerase IV subunit B